LKSADQEIKEALAAENAGHIQQAEGMLRELIKRYPDNFDVVEGLGLLYADMENFTSAFPFLEKATKLAPSSSVAHANLGAVYLKLNRNEKAVEALRKAALLDAKNLQTQTNLGFALMRTNQPRLAADAFGRAAQSAPHDPDLLYNWSVALLDAGAVSKAADVISRVSNSDSSAQMQSLLGDIAEHQDRFKDAVEHYQAAVNLDPSETNIYTLGIELLRHWTFEPAMKIFEYGLSRYPGSARLLSGEGIAKYGNNNYADSAQIFARLLANDPDNSMYAVILGRSCSLMPDSIDGCSGLDEFAERHPMNAEAAIYAAATILHQPASADNLALARKLLDQAIAVDPHLTEAYYQLGLLEQRSNRWEESTVVLEKCVALKPKLAQAHYRLAIAYSHIGQRDKAKEQFALQQKYSQEEKDELDARMKEVTTFLVTVH